MLQVGARDFQINSLKFVDLAHDKGESVIITKRGIPYAKLIPIETESRKLFGLMKGWSEQTGDIISPIDVEWEALHD